MTIIIGIETPVGTIIAGDRRLTSAGLKFPGRSKVFRNGDILYGISGDGGVISKLRYGCDLPRKFSPSEDQEQWAYSKLIPVLQEAIPDDESAWEMIVATKSEIISVDDSFDIIRSTRGYYAIGSGSKYATGVLEHKIIKGMRPLSQEDIVDAINAASSCDVNCGDGMDVLVNQLDIK